MSNRLSLLLLLLSVVLGTAVYFETLPENRPRLPPAATSAKHPKQAPVAVSAPDSKPGQPLVPPLAALTETLDRPLFSVDRRPVAAPESVPVAVVETPTSAPATLPPLVLSAIIINGDQRMALLQEPSPGAAMIHAEQGQTISGGWLLKEVAPERVVLSRDGQEHELILRKFQPPPQALLPAVAPRAPATRDNTQARPLTEALDLRRPRRPLRGPRLRSRQRNTLE